MLVLKRLVIAITSVDKKKLRAMGPSSQAQPYLTDPTTLSLFSLHVHILCVQSIFNGNYQAQ